MYLIVVSEDAVDVLREIGGVAFVFNLSKPAIVHSEVKITALFTLGALAEANGKQVKQMYEMVLLSFTPNKASASVLFILFSVIYTTSVFELVP